MAEEHQNNVQEIETDFQKQIMEQVNYFNCFFQLFKFSY
jgi:hypothetical protein